MISIDFYVRPEGEVVGFCSKGHAGYAAQGEDIVCAAVSSAVYMTANTITDVLGISPLVLYEDEGVMKLELGEKDAIVCRTIIQGLKLHLAGLEEQYAEHVKVSYMEV